MATKSQSQTVRTTKITTENVGIRGPITAPRSIFVLRHSAGGGGHGGSSSYSESHVMKQSRMPMMASITADQGRIDINNMLSGRQKEKEEMSGLNDRLEKYIQKVRFLEAQNKEMADELANLRDNWGRETEKVKKIYQQEIDQLRKLLDDNEKKRNEDEVRMLSLEEQINELKLLLDDANRELDERGNVINKLNEQLANHETELTILRRNAESFENERARDAREIKRLRDDVQRLRLDLDDATLKYLNAENEAQSLREQLEFKDEVHEMEKRELAALAYRDRTKENREYWQREMKSSLDEIRRDYEDRLTTIRSEMETQLSLKVNEARTTNTRDNLELTHIREENSRIKNQLADARQRIPELEARVAQLERELEERIREFESAEQACELEKSRLKSDLASAQTTLEEYLRELQNVMDSKLSLELEILAYRRLLDMEEKRIDTVNQTTELMSQRQATRTETSRRIEQTRVTDAQQQMNLIKGQMSAKTTFQRTAKGNIQVSECSPDGKFVVLENQGKKKEDIGGYKLVRNLDNGRQIIRYTLPSGVVLDDDRNKTIKIWAKGVRPSGSNEPEIGDQSWGIGANITTTLLNSDGEERATHTQKTVYSAN